MTSKTKLLGHAVHPMLVHVPLGLFVTTALFDTIDRFAGHATSLAVASFWNSVAGVASALVAAFFGMLDLFAIPRNTRAFRIGIAHGLGNLVMTGMFGICAALRWSNPGYRLGAGGFVLELAAVSLSMVTVWLGTELIEHLGVAVDDTAHLDAPSSLHDIPVHRPH